MRRRSKKQRDYLAEVREKRMVWIQSKPLRCMYCQKKPDFQGLHVHEMCRRSHAQRAWWHECNALLLCPPCHEGPFATMPHVEQLAVKLSSDPSDYDLDLWLQMFDPACDREGEPYITQDEVEDAIRKQEEG